MDGTVHDTEVVDEEELLGPDKSAADRLTEVARSHRGALSLAVGVAVVLALLVVIGALLRGTENPTSDPVPTTTASGSTTTVTSPLNGVLEPGMWTVVATFPESSASADQVFGAANEVRSWPGVLEVVEISDEPTWLEVTGLVCEEVGTGRPPCGPGIAVLTDDSMMPLTASRIESELAMNTLTPIEATRDFIVGYIKAAIERSSPRPLDFDPSDLGEERELFGTFNDYLNPSAGISCGPECFETVTNPDLAWHVGTRVDLLNDPDGTMRLEFQGTQYTVSDLLVDRSGRGGVLTELYAVVRGTRIYQFAFLPLDAAVITFEQADGTKVWQRPQGGLALLVDSSGTGGHSEWSDEQTAGPFIVLDEKGNEIMRIEDTRELSLREDLRMMAALTGTEASPTNPSDLALEVATVATIEDSPTGAMAMAAGDLWLQTDFGLTRVDAETGETESFAIGSQASQMISTGDALWLRDADSASVVRFDLELTEITDRIDLPQDAGRGSAMVFALGAVWVTARDMGYVRIDPITLAVETIPPPGSTVWIGEVQGDLWAMSGGLLDRINEATLTVDRIDTGSHPGGPYLSAVYSGDALWLGNWDLPTIARFDIDTLEVTDMPIVGRQGVSSLGAYVADGLWITNAGTEAVTWVNTTTGRITDVVSVPFGRPHVVGNSLWLVDSRQGLITHIDAETGQVTELGPLAGDGSYALVADDVLWIAGRNGTILRVETSRR